MCENVCLLFGFCVVLGLLEELAQIFLAYCSDVDWLDRGICTVYLQIVLATVLSQGNIRRFLRRSSVGQGVKEEPAQLFSVRPRRCAS